MPGLVPDLWRWWIGQLADVLPGSWRRALQGKRPALIVATDFVAPEGVPAAAARIERGGKVERLGRVAFDEDGLRRLKRAAASHGSGLETRLELPADAILEKRLTLPLAAERDLDRVLVYEMDRETPFSADEVYWVSQVQERDRASKRLNVLLAMVAKAPLTELVTMLARAGLAPASIAGAGGGVVISIAHDGARRGWSSRGTAVAASLCVVLAVAAVAIPFIQQGIALDDVEQRIDTLRPRVTAVERLRERVEGDRAQIESLAAQHAQFGDPLTMLAAVTAALPDDTHLTELDYAVGKVTLTGQSKAASHLIGDIARSSDLRDPVFSAPVTRAEQSQYDVFAITARMRQ